MPRHAPACRGRRPLEDRSARADHQRELVGQHAEPLDEARALPPRRRRRARCWDSRCARGNPAGARGRACPARPTQHRAGAVLCEEADAPEDERAHDDLAKLGGAHDEGPQMRRVDRHRGAALGTCPSGGEDAATGELAHVAAELARALDRDVPLVTQTVATDDLDASVEHQPRRDPPRAGFEDDLARPEGPRRTAGEALRRLHLRRVEHGKHLLAPRVDDAHAGLAPGVRGFAGRAMEVGHPVRSRGRGSGPRQGPRAFSRRVGSRRITADPVPAAELEAERTGTSPSPSRRTSR